jgi:hypothetical protein
VRLPAGSSCLRSSQCDSSSSPPAAASMAQLRMRCVTIISVDSCRTTGK